MEKGTRNALVIFCGPSGAGKTTVAGLLSRELAKMLPTIHVQTDAIRRMFVNPTYDKSESRLVYSILYDIARRLLPLGCNVVLDGTFLRDSYRERAIAIARYNRKRYLIVALKADLTTLIARNRGRAPGEYVPEKTITRFWMKFQYPLNGTIIDTDEHSPEECVKIILEKLASVR
ncbi:MAG: AAA family ATPase [Nitrososphaeria archaeon]